MDFEIDIYTNGLKFKAIRDVGYKNNWLGDSHTEGSVIFYLFDY